MLYLIPFLLLLAWLAIKRPWRMSIVVTDPGANGRRIDSEDWFGNYYPADTDDPRPGILVVGGSEGGLHGQVDRDARAFNREGYAVLAMSFFRGPGQREALALVPLELFQHALDWLGGQRGVDATRLAVVGMSKGAEAALLVASHRPSLAAIIAAAPSSVVWPGFDWSRFRGLKQSSWSLDGEALPALPYGHFVRAKGVRSIYEGGLADLSAYPNAVIPVERSTAMTLLICGGRDQVWPSCEMAEQIVVRRREHDGTPVTVLSYPDADHGVFGSPLEKGDKPRRFGFGRPAGGNPEAQADSWQRSLAFLREAFARR